MNDKVKKILMVIYVLTIVAMLATSTFAYFTYLNVSNMSPEVEAETATLEMLVFDMGNTINIHANQYNFGEDASSITEKTYASAQLIWNKEDIVEHTYDISLNIAKNDFEYSIDENSAELILTITDPEGNEVTDIDGLDYVSVRDINGKIIHGFDITTKYGKINIVKDYKIATSLTAITQIWNMEVTFVNLDASQAVNMGKELVGNFKIEKTS